jgi:hypothetical protein
MDVARVRPGRIPGFDKMLMEARMIIVKQNKWLAKNHGWVPKYGIDGISPTAISFHYVKPAEMMLRYDRLLYRLGRNDDECNGVSVGGK